MRSELGKVRTPDGRLFNVTVDRELIRDPNDPIAIIAAIEKATDGIQEGLNNGEFFLAVVDNETVLIQR